MSKLLTKINGSGFVVLKRHDYGVSLMVGQKSYTAELLKRHEHVSPKSCPMPKLDSSETDETDITTLMSVQPKQSQVNCFGFL